jgi:hypothetical protein
MYLRETGIEYMRGVEKHVSLKPWFSQIAASVKRWREAVAGEFASLSKNDTIVWVNEDFGFKRTVRTGHVCQKYNLSRVLQTEGLDARLPAHGVNTIAKGIKNRFFDERIEQEHGVLGGRRSNVNTMTPRGQMTSRCLYVYRGFSLMLC